MVDNFTLLTILYYWQFGDFEIFTFWQFENLIFLTIWHCWNLTLLKFDIVDNLTLLTIWHCWQFDTVDNLTILHCWQFDIVDIWHSCAVKCTIDWTPKHMQKSSKPMLHKLSLAVYIWNNFQEKLDSIEGLQVLWSSSKGQGAMRTEKAWGRHQVRILIVVLLLQG